MKKTLALALALAVAPFAASAGELSYTYVEGGYNKLHIDDDFLGSPDADGAFVRGSVALGDSVYLLGGVSRVSDDEDLGFARVDVDYTSAEFGVGFHQAIGDRADFIAELAYVREEFDTTVTGFGDAEDSFTGGRGAIGVRGVLGTNVEGSLKASYYDGGDFDGTFGGSAGLQYRFNPTWGVVGEIEVIEDTTRYLAGVRASF